MAYLAAAGLLMGAGGTFLKGRAGDIAKRAAINAANLPGLDTKKITEEALQDQEGLVGRASAMASSVGKSNQSNLLAMEEQALPGSGASRDKMLQEILDLLSGDFSADTNRRGAAFNVGSGRGGSPSGMISNLRRTDLEKTERLKTGSTLLNTLLGGLRIANSPGVQAFLGPTASDLINIRGQERANKQNLLFSASGIPGQTAAWGSWLQSTGGMMLGSGLDKGTSSPTSGSQSGTTSIWQRIGQEGWMNNDWYLGKEKGRDSKE